MYFFTFVFLIGLVALVAGKTQSMAKSQCPQPMRQHLDSLMRMKTVVGP